MSSHPRKKQHVSATYLYDSGEGYASHAIEDDDEEMDMADLPVEGGSVDEQIGAILDGSSDEEIVQILTELPMLDDGLKLIVGMQKLSPSASAFTLLQPVAEACTNTGISILFRKLSGLSISQLDSDIPGVFADDPSTAAVLMSHPPELRRRRFFMSLAAGYLESHE